MTEFIQKLPKAELHLHLEGTLEPELMFMLAQRNQVVIPFRSVEEVKEAYQFSNLQEFLDIYYQGCNVLRRKQDFYDLCYTYLQKLHSQNTVYVEMMFDPQAHTQRGIALDVVVEGIVEAQKDAQRDFGIQSALIFSFLRHLSEEDAINIWKAATPFKQYFLAVGLDSSELGNPPEKFKRVFDLARSEGFLTVAHAGEEGPASYIHQALDLLKVARIDHGNNCLQDEKLVQKLLEQQIPMTLCPLSNKALQVCTDLRQHPLKKMMDHGLLVSIHSDDPAYFGGQLNDNYLALTQALNLSEEDLTKLAIHSFQSSFLSPEEKKAKIQRHFPKQV